MDKTKKKTIRRYIGWAVLALVVVWLAAMPLLARQGVQDDGPVASVLTATADSGTIRTAIHGGGTLSAGEPEEVTVPKDVKITEFLVKNGDMVSQGDALAAVDKVSVMTAITGVQDSMATLRKQMDAVRDEKADTTISAAAGGRVKVVYAQTGDRVESVMLQHGALAVLSLDNKMCVTLEVPASLSTGDSVTVTLENGKTVKGFVESNLSGKITVTVEDNGYEVGQTVTVEGLGEGILEIHSPWAATAFTGKVSAVKVKPNQVLSSGASLFTLTDTDYTAQRELLASTHREYEELLQKLFQMYDTGILTAPCDGMVSGIDKDSTHLLAAVEEEELVATPLAAQEGSFRLVFLSNITPLGDTCPDCGQSEDNHALNCIKSCRHGITDADCPATGAHYADCIKYCGHGDTDADCSATGAHYADCIKACVSAEEGGTCPADEKHHRLTCVYSCIESDGTKECPAHRHTKNCISSCIHANVTGVCKSKYHRNDCIEACKNEPGSDSTCTATEHKDNCFFKDMTFKAIAAKVFSPGQPMTVAPDVPGFQECYFKEVRKTASGWVFADESVPNKNIMITEMTAPWPSQKTFDMGDIVLFIQGCKNEQAVWYDIALYEKATPTSGKDSGIPDLGMSGFGGMGSLNGSGQSQLYDLTGDVLLSVTPQEEMTLTVSVDESDISSIALGMEAEITVYALPGETFTGSITHISRSGTGNGGSSKFAVELTLPHESQMLSGMSASAILPLSEKSGILTLPAAAIVEEGGKTLVYTAADKKTGDPISPVEVTTGVSDGQNVEILSGLQKGDRVYYKYYDTMEESDAVEINRIPMM